MASNLAFRCCSFLYKLSLHMVIKHHNSDFQKIPDEERVMDELRKANIPPGDYVFPYAKDEKERNSQEYKDKYKKGPVAMVTFFPTGQTGMGSSLVLWFIYSLVVGVFAAYITGHALPAGANYLSVFRFAGCTAFVSYSLALLQTAFGIKEIGLLHLNIFLMDNLWFIHRWSLWLALACNVIRVLLRIITPLFKFLPIIGGKERMCWLVKTILTFS